MKKIRYLIIGSAFLGGLSGTVPPMVINASPNINEIKKRKIVLIFGRPSSYIV